MFRTIFLLLLFVSQLPAALAHQPEYFGRKYVLWDAETSPKPALACGGDQRGALQKRAATLQAELEPQRLGAGAYAATLADALGELGTVFAEVCNHPAALKSFREALQRMRINDGLLTKSQIPFLKALADSSQSIGDFRSAQLNYRYLFRIHNQGHGALDEQALEDSLEYFARAREIFIHPVWSGDVDLFFQAFRDNERMLEAQQERNEIDYAWFKALGLSHLYNIYLLLGTEMAQLQPDGMAVGSAATHMVSGERSLAYSKGIRLLEDLLERAAEQPAVGRGELHFRLGNWHMWNGKWRRACKAYAQAWLLSEGTSGAALRRQISQPAELPEDPAIWESLLDSDVRVKAVVEASFKVTSNGSVTSVDTQRVDGGGSVGAGTVYRWLRDSHARPAIVEGACADGYLAGRSYRLLK